MQKTMIKSLLAVAVAATFATCANAAVPNDRNDWYTATGTMSGSIDPTKVQENFDNLDQRVEANKTDISTVNSALAGKVDQTDFDNLNNRLFEEGTGVLSNLEAANTQLNQKIDTTQGNIDNLNNRLFAEGTGILHNLEAADAQLNQKIDATASTLQGNIDTNKANIQTNADNIATNKANIQTNANNIATNANNIAANRTLIEQYKASSDAQFKAVNSRIDSLDDKMKKGFASQAALNGLFQPYNVGKFNVSAAIGGYDSEQAMALGTGYRFNDNFAIKAGVASDLSGFDHVTYNIGANFEF